MENIILKNIEMNENYHDKKEKMAWIASSIYFAFSLLILRWLIDETIDGYQKIMLLVLLAVIYTSALCFISLQFKLRWESVEKSDALREVLRNLKDLDLAPSFPDKSEHYLEIERNKDENKRKMWLILLLTISFPILLLSYAVYKLLGGCKWQIDSRYRTEIPTYTIITYFFIAQLILLICRT